MTDANFRKTRYRIKPYIEKWRELLYMNNIEITLYWDRGYSTDPVGVEATTTMDRWKYFEFEMRFFLPEIMDKTDDEIESLVVHELAHCLLAPLSMSMKGCDESYQTDIMEMNTSQVTYALLNTYREKTS